MRVLLILAVLIWALPLAPLPAATSPNAQSPIALQRETIRPASASFADGCWSFDFKRAAFAQFEIDAPAAIAGRTITLRLGEAVTPDGQLNPKAGPRIRFFESKITLVAGVNRPILPAPDARRMPPEIGPVMPFRYAEVSGWPDAGAAPTVRQIAVFAPFDNAAAEFECDRADLNEIWQLCKYSMKATSFCGLFVDGDRERLPYEADAYLNQLGWYATAGTSAVPRATLEFLLEQPTWPTEWQAHTIFMTWADYLQTGDREFLDRHFDRLKLLTLTELERGDGLISTTVPSVSHDLLSRLHLKRIEDNVDWPRGERDGYDFRPINTAMNAFHFASLDRMAQIATAIGRPGDAATLRTAATRVRDAINTKLFDSTRGLYVDGEGSAHASIHANFFPLALGVVPTERAAAVGRFLAGGMKCSVYGAQYLLEALYSAGQAEAALQLMLNRTDRGWWHMIHEVGTTITLEAWDTKYKPNQDYNHAWGAAPANLIPRFIVGIEPLEPRWTLWRLHPRPVRYARTIRARRRRRARSQQGFGAPEAAGLSM
jgi:hypothetical protein